MTGDLSQQAAEIIAASEGDALDRILRQIIRRYSQLLPEYELVCLFLPREDAEERNRILGQTWEFLQNREHKSSISREG